MSQRLLQMIYTSTATQEAPDIDGILESSVRHNLANGITGMLLYCDGGFIQVLEGEESAVDETYARICRDLRHRDLNPLAKTRVTARDFPGWSMGFRRLTSDDVRAYAGHANLLPDDCDLRRVGAKEGIALDLLKWFANR